MKKFFNRIFNKDDTKEIVREATWDTSTNTVSTNGGITWWPSTGYRGEVGTESMAMKIAAYYRALNILSGTISTIPFNHKKKLDGVFQTLESNMQYILTIRANQMQTASEFVKEIVLRTLNTGNCYVYPRTTAGRLEELVILEKGSVTYDKNLNIYRVVDVINGVSGIFHPFQLIHIRNVGLDGGYTGMSVIRYASRCLGIAQAADEQSLETFEGGSMVKGMVTGDSGAVGFGKHQESQLSTVGDRINAELQSGKNIISLPSGIEFKSLQMTVAEAKLLEHREFSVMEICRFTGVPPEKMFASLPPNYKASELSQINFLNDGINPLLTQIEQEFSSKLIPRQLAFSEKIEADREALLNTDITARADYYAKMHGMGAMTTNEVRKRQGLTPVPGGDKPLISTNLQELTNLKVDKNE